MKYSQLCKTTSYPLGNPFLESHRGNKTSSHLKFGDGEIINKTSKMKVIEEKKNQKLL